MYGHDWRMFSAVLDATAGVDTVPVASLHEARRLAQEIACIPYVHAAEVAEPAVHPGMIVFSLLIRPSSGAAPTTTIQRPPSEGCRHYSLKASSEMARDTPSGRHLAQRCATLQQMQLALYCW